MRVGVRVRVGESAGKHRALMDHLGVILQGALSPNPDERKAAEQSLDQVLLFFFFTLVHDW